MITLLATLNNAINDMRFLGKQNFQLFKKILYYIILNDIGEWALINGDGVLYNNINKYIEHKTTFDCEFATVDKYMPIWYTSTNIPEDYYMLDRTYDNSDVVTLPYNVSPVSNSWEEDKLCEQKVVKFPGYTGDIFIDATEDGLPFILNFNNLTTCEKMNIYVNRDTGKAYYFDDKGNPLPLLTTISSDTKIDYSQIENPPIHYNGLDSTVNENTIDITLNESNEQTTSIPLVSEDDINQFV